MIRDRIVVGLQDVSLSEKLQLGPNLTLEKAVTAAHQKEAVKQQQSTLRSQSGSTLAASVDAMQAEQQKQPHTKHTTGKTESSKEKVCGGCGKFPSHKVQQCPAKDVTCHKCGKKGHYQTVCRSKTVGDITTGDDVFLGSIQEDKSEPWTVTILVNDKPITFKLDTGADVTVISKALSSQIIEGTPQPPKKNLLGPDQKTLPVIGQFTASLKSGTTTCSQTVYVVPDLHMPLLGQPAIQALELVKQVGSVEDKTFDPQKAFPALFRNLGKLSRPYHIQMKEGAKPFALTAPRCVPVPLLPRVKAELAARSNYSCQRAYRLVFRDGGSAKATRQGENLCGPYTIE